MPTEGKKNLPIDGDLHKEIKVTGARTDRDMGDLVREAWDQWKRASGIGDVPDGTSVPPKEAENDAMEIPRSDIELLSRAHRALASVEDPVQRALGDMGLRMAREALGRIPKDVHRKREGGRQRRPNQGAS